MQKEYHLSGNQKIRKHGTRHILREKLSFWRYVAVGAREQAYIIVFEEFWGNNFQIMTLPFLPEIYATGHNLPLNLAFGLLPLI